ncbi:MAG: hypothetical protein H7Y17_07470, partial [Chlorobia bacterium]|nr:hypothetical protein [Fimbriimonadaceae bacterium]
PDGVSVADASLLKKLELIVAGIPNVPLNAIKEDLRERFTELVKELATVEGFATTVAFVLAGWVAAQAAGPIAWAITAALIGIAAVALKDRLYEWLEKFAKFIKFVANAKTEADIQRCSLLLAELIILFGVGAFMTFIAKAAGKKSKRTPNKPEEELRTAPPKPVAARPTARQSEIDAKNLAGPNARSQISYKNGKEVPYGTPGSTRPDWVSGNVSTEVKNYTITGNSNTLSSNIAQQAQARAQQLPAGMQQKIIVDVRGQIMTPAQEVRLIQDVVAKSNGVIRPNNIFIRR